jgi:N-acetylglucosamine kinase-like BadF-type ATPase
MSARTDAGAPRASLVLGVDGGNTKTIAIVATSEGEIIGAGRAGCADIYNAESEQAALDAIRCAVDEALAGARVEASELRAGAFSLAGADWPEDFALLRREIGRFGFGQEMDIVNDAIGALRAGTADGVGVALACGTGIAIGARNGDGDVWYSGHWPIAAGGSELGVMTLRAVYKAHLGLGPRTMLTEGILAFFEAKSVEDVLKITTERGTPWTARPQLARLAPVLLNEVSRGDEVAREILFREATRHANAAHVAAREVGLDATPLSIVLTGGVLRHPSGLLEEAIGECVETFMPEARIINDSPEPVVGAVLLAMDLAGAADGPAVVEQLVATMPGPELFDT